MSSEMCRLCLTKDNLSPIFVDVDNSDKYSSVLTLTTGLQIELNDGLPQFICKKCTDSVNSALNLRNRSQLSEIELLKLGFKRKNTENIPQNNETDEQVEENKHNFENSTEDYYDFDGFKIEVELDRLTEEENGCQTKENAANDESKHPSMSVKQKRQMYMKLVDGVFDPKGPVKCKVCKKTLSKWSCFISHAKKHLGFKFICEFCGKSFISSTQLKRHCRSHHGMERDLKCKHCSYLALDNAQLMVHERRVHTGERPYVCDICAAAYFSRKCLVQHIESHITTASIQCVECPQLFKSHRHLAKHRYSAHGGKSRMRRRQRRERQDHADESFD